MELNERAQTKVIHISLNFPPEEKEKMTKEFLVQLADEYMERLGFGEQPYLVYQHHDSGHPHVHVVSTLIKEDGTRINTHHLGKDVSEPARKAIEIKYSLISSNKKEFEQKQERDLAVTPQRIQAGKSATMRSIANVLDHVVEQYKYTSLEELNAILKLYNVKADRGVENGRIYKNRGLTYMVTDKEGNALTKPIKASAFHSKPTLNYLEGKFDNNEKQREGYKKPLRTAIDWALQSRPETLGELSTLLAKERIALVVRHGKEGRVYGMTYIDHEHKTVFNGSDLGKEYAAKKMLERLGMVKEQKPQADKQKQQNVSHKSKEKLSVSQEQQSDKEPTMSNSFGKKIGKVIEEVITPEYTNTNYVDRELTEEQRRRRRRQQELDQGLEF